MAKWHGLIPWENGKPLTYESLHREPSDDFDWLPNDEFDDTLTFVYFSRGRSAARAVFRSKTHGCTVEMFLATLADVMPSLDKGKLKGRFKFEKRGENFGIKPVEF